MAGVKAVKRVMIACVTTEVVKVTDPAIKLNVDIIHLLNYVKKADSRDPNQISREELFESVYQENVKKLKEAGIWVKEHRDVPIFIFDEFFRTIYKILADEKKWGSAVYVNISSGPPEYSAAAAIASMMMDGVELFTVGAKASGYTVPFERQKELLMHDGKLVGSAFEVYDPIKIDKFPLPTPDLKLLNALKIFASIPEVNRSNVKVIRELILHRAWRFSSSDDDCALGTSVEFEDTNGEKLISVDKDLYAKRQNKEAVQYQRAYIDSWKEKGWIEKSEINGKRYRLTKTGQRYIDTFCI
ncbi:MAG: DUF6293 family protein [Candidatus Methanomethylophilaceae archaeon]